MRRSFFLLRWSVIVGLGLGMGSGASWAQQSTTSGPCGSGLDSIAAASPARCNWQAFTSDQRSFAAQPGGVCPIGTYRPGEYSILVGPAGRNGQDLPPAWWNTYGPFTFVKGDKWIAILGRQSRLDRVDKNVGELLQYRDPGSRTGVYVRNNDPSEWQAICVVAASGAVGGDEGRCAAYAELSVQQQRQNLARQCGFEGDPWHTDRAEHERWCLTVPPERSAAETAMRNRELDACQGGYSDESRCEHYASVAVWQQQENVSRHCGLSGDPWHTDDAEHRRWCLTVPAERSAAELSMRDDKLAACAGGGGTGCGDYARAAVAQQQENLARGCGFSGDPWHTDYGEHFRWCQSVPAERSTAENAMRQNQLAGCR